MQILKVSISLLKLSTAKQWRCVTKQWRRVTKVYLKETFTRKIPEKLFQKFIHFHARFSFRRVAGAAAPGGFEVPPPRSTAIFDSFTESMAMRNQTRFANFQTLHLFRFLFCFFLRDAKHKIS